MINNLQVEKPFIQRLIEQPVVKFGCKITVIALAAIALIFAIAVPMTYLIPLAPIPAILALRISFIGIFIGAIELINLAYRDLKKEQNI